MFYLSTVPSTPNVSPSGDLVGDISTRQGNNRELFLRVESHDHSTINDIDNVGTIAGFGKIQPHGEVTSYFSRILQN